MANEQMFHVGVKALIRNQLGEVLVLKADVATFKTNSQAYWDIPGGRIQQGGNLLNTLSREIEEEIGKQHYVQPRMLTTIVSNHVIPVGQTKTVGLLLVVYEVDLAPDAEIVLSPEHTAYEWVQVSEAKKRLAHKYPVEFISAL